MTYAQKNYAQIQGINGKYKISQIGCFLTAFCNLLERFGMGVDPATLNNIFIQRGIYMDIDDGIRDDLGWQSVTAYNGQIVTTVKSGAVTDRSAIVRLAASNSFGTHFCLVDSVRADGVYIVDSWDGQVKRSDVYGPITGWAMYTLNKPQPVGEQMSKDVLTKEEVIELHRAYFGGNPGASYDYRHVGGPLERLIQDWKGSPDRLSVQLANVKTALANEQAKPPVEVIKTVEKIVEKPVIKEVPVPADEKATVEGWLKRVWNSLFKKESL